MRVGMAPDPKQDAAWCLDGEGAKATANYPQRRERAQTGKDALEVIGEARQISIIGVALGMRGHGARVYLESVPRRQSGGWAERYASLTYTPQRRTLTDTND